MVVETRVVEDVQVAALVRREPSRLTINRLGLWLFIISESFLFGAIISSRYFLRVQAKSSAGAGRRRKGALGNAG